MEFDLILFIRYHFEIDRNLKDSNIFGNIFAKNGH